MSLSTKFKIGVTGSRHGWTSHQVSRLHQLLDQIPYSVDDVECHHGCCVGGDATAHSIFKRRGYRVVGHPPDNLSLMMTQDLMAELDSVHPPKPYNDRNLDIVLCSDLLYAGPSLPRYRGGKKQKSGSWNTIEMGFRNGILVEVVMPLPWEGAQKPESMFFTN